MLLENGHIYGVVEEAEHFIVSIPKIPIHKSANDKNDNCFFVSSEYRTDDKQRYLWLLTNLLLTLIH